MREIGWRTPQREIRPLRFRRRRLVPEFTRIKVEPRRFEFADKL